MKSYHNNQSSTFIPAERVHQPPATIAPLVVTDHLPPAIHTGYARQDDDALTHARATLLVAAAYIAAALLITCGLLLIIWLFRGLGERLAAYWFTGLVLWGVCILAALWGNRRQSLHHSPTGVTHAEIQSRERLARHAIDTHADLLIKRWDRDSVSAKLPASGREFGRSDER
jgi:uncharacterized membrane protein YqjE